MFKKLSSLEKSMREILLALQSGDITGNEGDKDFAYALYCCCEKGYILNLHYSQVCTGEYVFQKSQNILVSFDGLKFLKETSLTGRISKSIFDVLRGLSGFLLGILATVCAQYLIYLFGLS